MNKFYPLVAKVAIVVLLWWGSLSLFARVRVEQYGVAPTFPYYSSLLTYVPASSAVWGHFDGAHYLKLASVGYVDQGTQAFFPVYPLLIRLLHSFGLPYFTAGVFLSLTSLILAIMALQYLLGKSIWGIALPLLLLPTSFYFGAIYTESLFLLLTVIFFILLKQRRYGWAALLAGIASGTRIAGSLLVISLFIEIYPHLKKRPLLSLLLPVALSGLFGYMYFLWREFGDPLMFVHVQSMFGAGRSSGELVLLPQVIYRYLKILLTVSPISLLFQRALLELFVSSLFLAVLIRRWRSLPISWSIYLLGSLILPTLSGSLSSLPRYALVIAPFLFTPPQFNTKSVAIVLTSLALLLSLFSLFVSGQFVA